MVEGIKDGAETLKLLLQYTQTHDRRKSPLGTKFKVHSPNEWAPAARLPTMYSTTSLVRLPTSFSASVLREEETPLRLPLDTSQVGAKPCPPSATQPWTQFLVSVLLREPW
jgi:hypothetical protein